MGKTAVVGVVAALVIIVAAAVLIAVIFAAMYNGLVKMKNRCDEAFATMDVYLKKRYDLVPNLVETVKGYAKHESQTLENVISARNKAISSQTTDEKIANDKNFSSSLSKLLMLKESYPDLKADKQFNNLQNQLMSLEDDIAQSRKYYNAVARELNTKIEVIPTNFIAGICHFGKREYYTIENGEERNNVKVQF